MHAYYTTRECRHLLAYLDYWLGDSNGVHLIHVRLWEEQKHLRAADGRGVTGSGCQAKSKTGHGICMRVMKADHFTELRLEARAKLRNHIWRGPFL